LWVGTIFDKNRDKWYNHAMTQLSQHHWKDDHVGGPLYEDYVLIPKNSWLRNSEKTHFNKLIDSYRWANIVEIEIREEARILLQKVNPRTPDILYTTYTVNSMQKRSGFIMQGIQKMTIDSETYNIQTLAFSLWEYAELRDFFYAIEKYLKSEMQKKGYKSYINKWPFPGTLRFSKIRSKFSDRNL
jgi:hypothetical protein